MHSISLAILMGFLVAAAFAQRDPFAGVFVGDNITLELKGTAAKYTGTVTVQGQAFPVTASAVGTTASGTFAAAGMNYPFTLTPYGNGFKLASEGAEYLLVRKVESASPPAAPAGGSSIMGRWRNAQGMAQFNADGTGVIDGQQGRYDIRGDQLTLTGAQGQMTVSFAVNGDQLTLNANGNVVTLQRVKDETSPQPAAPAGGSGSIVGLWRNSRGTAQFNADGTGSMDGQPGRYVIRGDQVTLIGAQAQMTLKFQVNGDQLTLTGPNGIPVAMQRVKEEAGPGSIHMELLGKWCWTTQVYANNGGARQSNRCITLNGNGSYEYFGLVDSYNPYGGASSESHDQGTWTATETSLTTRSVSGRVTVYRLEKRNHPKNVRDPMIVLNGETFVTAYAKAPW
jgi:hypothetical protein